MEKYSYFKAVVAMRLPSFFVAYSRRLLTVVPVCPRGDRQHFILRRIYEKQNQVRQN